jgi:hypothetical protein
MPPSRKRRLRRCATRETSAGIRARVTILAISGLFGGKAVQPAALMTLYVKD